MKTIVAAATPLTIAHAIGIIRLSGDEAVKIASEIFSSNGIPSSGLEERRMYLGEITTEQIKDKAFCVYYKAPKSYTGEDIIEFHTHGGIAVMKGVLSECIRLGASPAKAGEFTKRAFLNGKITLSEAEGIVDLINAESRSFAQEAYRMASGELSLGIKKMEEKLLLAAASLEVALDYPEELMEDTLTPSYNIIKEAEKELSSLLESSASRKYVTSGVNIVIAGAPNAGKSSLLNAILKDDRAIVTNIAGTTRDTLKESIEINGILYNFTDTAGIRNTEIADTVEKIGIKRAKQAVEGADLLLIVLDLEVGESENIKELFDLAKNTPTIIVGNKGDKALFNPERDITIEANTGKNIDELISLIEKKLGTDKIVGGGLTRERHIFAIKSAKESLSNALSSFYSTPPDCLIVDIKEACSSLSEILGTDVNEAIVDKIFSEFCVGK